MKATENAIKSVGLSTLYDPHDTIDPVVDIVLVHGFGGHPVRSWKWFRGYDPPPTAKSAKTSVRTGSFRKLLRKNPPLRRSNSEPLLGLKQDSSGRSRNVLRKNSAKSISRLRLDTGDDRDPTTRKEAELYWPLALLPVSCPSARILVWGYHTLVVDGKPLRLQNDIFAHGRDLLWDLATSREASNTNSRPIIFIAHSTGGIVVKEALRLSEFEKDEHLRQILLSTSATIFMGSPHRSSEHARLGDAVRSMANLTLRVDADDVVLQELTGSTSVELEIGRREFIRQWNDYNFKVKSFQESMASSLSRADAFLRRQASFFGHPRETAETIQADHLDMCKFHSSDNTGYRALVNTLARFIHSESSRRNTISDRELACLAALSQPQLPVYETQPIASYPGTCLWLYDLPEFQAWHRRSNGNKNRILWLKGESGSGKSVLLRSLRNRIDRQWRPAGGSIIWARAGGQDTSSIYFPGACRQFNETDPSKFYRSLLAQLFLQDPRLRKALVSLYEKHPDPRTFDDALVVSFFVDEYIDQKVETPTRRTFIFVDVSDDCGPSYLRDLLASLSQLARNSDFNICVASGQPRDITAPNAVDIPMHLRNADDILRFVNLNLVAEWEERNRTVVRIGQKAGGVFLWAEIVVNILNAAIGEGASQDLIDYTLEEMPEDLHGLYEWMLGTLNEDEKEESIMLFQWVILAAEPMRLNDLLIAVRLTKTWPYGEFRPCMSLQHGTPSSMKDLRKIRNSEITSDTPYQFHRWIRSRSIGLLELRSESRDGLVNEPWGLQRVQVTHDSVRTFFLSGRGFACLAPASVPATCTTEEHLDRAHYSLLHACLSYLNMRDFEHLGHATATTPTHGAALPLSYEESRHWQRSVLDQRNLIVSSYPFLQYAAHNLLFHMLAPQQFRYFPPQNEILRMFSANRCRLWRRWTSLLGTPDPDAILAAHDDGPARRLLSPVFGTRYRLARIFRRLARTAAAEGHALGSTGGILSPISPNTPKSASTERTLWSPRSAISKGPLSPISPMSPLSRSGEKTAFILGAHNSRGLAATLGLAK